jgi:hypothetical protein
MIDFAARPEFADYSNTTYVQDGRHPTAAGAAIMAEMIRVATSVATGAADTTPNAFTFTDVTGATVSTVYTSNTITVTGINAAAAISITGGTYSVNGGSYTSASGTVNNGDIVTVRVTSSASNSTAVNATLTIGGVSDVYSVTTQAASVTLAALTLSPTSATAGSAYSGTISGKTSGSTITATSSDGTTLTVSGTTVSGTFSAAGTPTITLTETLAGATNSPRSSTISFTVNAASWTTTNGPITMSSDITGWNGYTIRQYIPASKLSTSGSKVRIRLVAAAAAQTVIDACYIGHRNASGDPYDFDGTQVQVLFSGATGVTLTAAGASVVSDAITYALDEAKDLVIAFHFSGPSSIRQGTDTGSTYYYKSAVNEAATANVTSYTASGNRAIVDLIEVQ